MSRICEVRVKGVFVMHRRIRFLLSIDRTSMVRYLRLAQAGCSILAFVRVLRHGSRIVDASLRSRIYWDLQLELFGLLNVTMLSH